MTPHALPLAVKPLAMTLLAMTPLAMTHRMRLVCDEPRARRLADALMEGLDPQTTAAAAFEEADTADWRAGPWVAEVYFAHAPDKAALRASVALILDPEAAMAVVFDVIAQRDWVGAALAGLAPVRAGRFLLHGAHDRAARRPHLVALEIEAALAFGTGHHGTTRGCLMLLDAVLRRRRPRRILDIGTGTGVLAIAAAKALRRSVAAGDIDHEAVSAAAANARLNGVQGFVRPVVAAGVDAPGLRSGAPYDLIFANILARPLRRLAPALTGVAEPRCDIILSGLLAPDVAGVLSAYASQRFYLARRIDIEGWASLALRRRE